jgi:hypothetical protein
MVVGGYGMRIVEIAGFLSRSMIAFQRQQRDLILHGFGVVVYWAEYVVIVLWGWREVLQLLNACRIELEC